MAPVEDLPFSEVRYWDELTRNLDIAVTAIPAILGLCWGGQVLAYRLGVDKIVFPQKKFGVYDLKNLDTANPSMKHLPAHFPCPLSSHAGYEDRVLEEAQDRGLMRLLAHAPETGYLVMESWDRQFAIHLGHPEYRAGRLGAEYERDVAAGREDVAAPENYCVEAPEANWKESGNAYFQNWIDAVIARKNP